MILDFFSVVVTLAALFSARTQPIISNSTPDMMKDHFLPIANKLKLNASLMDELEKRLSLEKRHSSENSEDFEQHVQNVCPKFILMHYINILLLLFLNYCFIF